MQSSYLAVLGSLVGLSLRMVACGATAKIGVQPAPRRLVSLNLCADQLVLALVDRDAVRSVTWLAREPQISMMASEAASLPINHSLATAALRATGTEALRHRTLATLSGGERMRVLLARALAVEAAALVADEPIAGLDPYHQLHVLEVLQETARWGTQRSSGALWRCS